MYFFKKKNGGLSLSLLIANIYGGCVSTRGSVFLNPKNIQKKKDGVVEIARCFFMGE